MGANQMSSSPRRPRVWVINQSYQYDYSKAKEFGDLTTLTKGKVNIFSPENLVPLLRTRMKAMKNEDFLLVCGHSVLTFFVIHEALRKMEEVKLLVYGAKYQDYAVVPIRRDFFQPEVTKIEIEDVLEEQGEFISKIARKYARNGDPFLNYEDLIAEAHYVLAKVFYTTKQDKFENLFRASVKNRFLDLWRSSNRQIHLVELDTTQAVEFYGSVKFEDFFEQEQIKQLRTILSNLEIRVLRELMHPSEKTKKSAIEDLVKCRKRLIYKAFNISNRNIAEGLGISKSQVDAAIFHIKAVLSC